VLLAIETATDVCSVALVDEGAVVAVAEILRPRAHAGQLAPLIASLLEREGMRAVDLGAVAVSAGPGSYTGLRIGVSTAKGLCFASGAALVAVPSLEALASSILGLVNEDDLIVAAFGSRRNELYLAGFAVRGNGLVSAADPAALSYDEVDRWLPTASGRLWLIGEGAVNLSGLTGRPHLALDPAVHRPSAASVGRLGWRRWEDGTVEDLPAFEPYYLKPFEARRGASVFDRLPHK
jgi:tRNA threonylcarbamoyladenosine biosynthesis protein TsaB